MPIIRIRRGTTTQWSASTRVLQVGELGLDTTLNKIKAGNGTSVWSSLSFLGVDPQELQNILNDANTYTDEAISSLGNSLPESYVSIGDVGNPDGVASLDANGKIPDSEIPSTIARDSELFSGDYDGLINKPTIPSLTGYATETYVENAISNLVDTAPSTLNTLNELAAALGDDANYASTISTALGLKAPIADPIFTGTVGGITKSMVDLANVDNTSDANKPVSTATQTALDLKLPISEPAIDYYVSNLGSGSYTVNGISNAPMYFEKGKKYRIVVNATGHPFWIQSVSGAYSSGNIYNTGITNNGTQSGSIIVELPQNAPTLYYACQFHSSMAGSILNITQILAATPSISGTLIGRSNTSTDNVSLGYLSLSSNTSGNQNTAVGYQTLQSNTSGQSNIAVGNAALWQNTTGSDNIGLGYYAAGNNTSGKFNIAIGGRSLFTNTTGDNNVAIGLQALLRNTTGGFNVALGLSALVENTTGFENTAIGGSLSSNTTGLRNIAVGSGSLYRNVIGNFNSSVGFQSLFNNTADNNTAIGSEAGSVNTTGTNNTFIGYRADASSATISNQITLGNADVSTFRIVGLGINWTRSAYGRATYASTSAPSGGSDGDVWLVYTA